MIELKIIFSGQSALSEHEPRAFLIKVSLIIAHYQRYLITISHLHLYLLTLDVLRLVEI